MRGDRLADLAALNFERLQLQPITRNQFGALKEVGYPLPEFDIDALLGSVEVRGQIENTEVDGDRP